MPEQGVTYQQLIDYAAGDLSGPAAASVEALTATDAVATRTIALHRTVGRTLQGDDGVEPPPAALAAARAIFRQADKTSVLERLSTFVDEVVGRLVFDSRAQPALAGAGLRGVMAGFQVCWELDDADLDLQLEMIGGSDEQRWHLIGQMSTPGPGPGTIRVDLCRPGTTDAVATAHGDERGVFTIDVSSGTYDLRLHRGTSVAVFPELRVP